MRKEWRDVTDYEGIYQVSDRGRVKSLFRRKRIANGAFQPLPEKVLRPAITKAPGKKDGYLCVVLCVNGKGRTKRVHILVARAFVPNPLGKPFVNHKDGIKLNCSSDNLEWVTVKENAEHARLNGLTARGKRLPQSKLSDDNVREILTCLERGDNQYEIAERFGINQSQISAINTGKNYSHVSLKRRKSVATRREKEQREVRYADAKDRAEKHDKGFEPTALNVPKGAKLFRFKKKGLYRLDFLPFVAGKGNPFADEGFLAYERTYFAHRIPTATGTQMYVCLARTYSAKCPVCAFIAKALREGTIDQKTAKDMEVKERQLFNVIDLENSKEGVQLFEFNWFQLGKLIDSRVDKKEKYKSFYHLKGGYTIEIEVDEDSFMGKTVYKPVGISFEPRDNYDDDILNQVHNLDEIPKRMTYEELEKILLEGGEDGKEKDTPPPSKNGHAKVKVMDDDDDELEEDEDTNDEDNKEDNRTAENLGIEKGSKVSYRKKEWDVLKVSSDGTSLTLEDDEGEQERGVAPGEVKLIAGSGEEEEEDELEEEEDGDPTPARGVGKKTGGAAAGKSSTSRSEDDEDEDELDEEDELEEDEDEEDEPAPKKKKRAG